MHKKMGRNFAKEAMKKTVFILMVAIISILCLAPVPATAAGTALSAGDIVFVGINSDGDDDFAFLLLKDITAGTSIYITDKGWNDGTGFHTEGGDGIFEWSTASNLSAGTVVHIKTSNDGVLVKPGSTAALAGTPLSLQASIGTVTWIEDNSSVISYTGDQVFLYQGTEASPTFIAGIHYNVETATTGSNWDGSAISVMTSALPNQLTNGVNAMWVYESGPTERDNFRYNCSTTSGTPSELRAAINNLANWNVDTSNSTAYTLNPFPVNFTVIAAAPTVTNISPSIGPATGGTGVTITGTDFTGATAVKFGSTNAASYTVNSATSITATSPAGSEGTVDITVTTAGGTSPTGASDRFTYDGTAPTLQSVVRDSDTQITVALSEATQNLTKANDGGFTVCETGAPGTAYAVSATAQGSDNSHVVLTVADMGVSAKEGVTVTYTAGGNGTIQDLAGNVLATDGTGLGIAGWDTTAPAVNTSTLNESNSYLDITFDEGIYGAGDGATALTAAKMSLIFTQNSGTATNAVISSIKKNDDDVEGSATALSGGETEVRVFITITGTPSGIETIELKPLDATAIYDKAGNPMASTHTTGPQTLNDKTGPIAGGSGTITAGNITQSSIDISWIAATDDATAQAGLQYKLLSSSDDNINTVADAESNGTIVQDWTANLTDKTVAALTASTTYYFNVVVKDEAGNKTAYTSVAQTTAAASSGDSTPQITVTGQTAGTTTTSTKDGQTVTTVTVDPQKLEQRLEFTGNKAKVVIPVSGSSDIVEGVLNGQTVKSMENKEAVLEIKTEGVTYTLPASQINIDAVSQELGEEVSLEDIKVSVRIAEPPADTVRIVEDTANKNSYQIVVKPIEFEITCTSGDKTVDVSKFSGYVERTIAIPEGIDPGKITTGVVLNDDGSFSHVPTTIVVINGKYYAKINSLTNSIYSVIWNQVEFQDVTDHWAREAINDMGSRLIIGGIGNNLFAPNRDITRAEFASIIVRALGLKPGTGANKFNDVKTSDWYYSCVKTASEYKIINGYGNGIFGPQDKITREQAMAMAANAMKTTGLKAELSSQELKTVFSSFGIKGTPADWAKNSVVLCIKIGVIEKSDGEIRDVKGNITRAEAAQLIRRLLQKSNLI